MTLRSLAVIVPGLLIFIGLFLLIGSSFPDLSLGWTAIIWYGVSMRLNGHRQAMHRSIIGP